MPSSAKLPCTDHQLHQLPHRCLQRQRQPLRPRSQPALHAARSPASSSGSTVLYSLQCARQRSLTCRSYSARNGFTAGLNKSVDEGDHEAKLDNSLKGRCARFVTRLYDWGVRSTDEQDTLNTREQAPLTWLDKASLVVVRALQTVIMLALAWHVYSWISMSLRLLAWQYSLSWPAWLTLK